MGPASGHSSAGALLLAALILPLSTVAPSVPLPFLQETPPSESPATATFSDLPSPEPSSTNPQPASPTSGPSLTPSSAPELTPSASATASLTAAPTPEATATATSTALSSSPTSQAPTASPTNTATTTGPVATPSPTQVAPGAVLINEVAWGGTFASATDEWIELHNPAGQPISLDGWRLTDGDDIEIDLSGAIVGFGYLLLERTDDSTVNSVPADTIYTGALGNTGETLVLLAPNGQQVDSANSDGGPWPAGHAAQRRSMERLPGPDLDDNWMTFAGLPFATDAGGNLIAGSPRSANQLSPQPSTTPTPSPATTPTPVPAGRALINEIAWAGTGASAADEWIELHNPEPTPLALEGWRLTDGDDIDIALAGLLPASGYYLLERTDDQTVASIAADLIYTGALKNDGEPLQLLSPHGQIIDRANHSGDDWPAGEVASRSSMERAGPGDLPSSWQTFAGEPSAQDAAGDDIDGSPRAPNSVPPPTATPSSSPTALPAGALLINEVAWAGTNASASDEWIELLNRSDHPIDLDGWLLTDGDDLEVSLVGVVAAGDFHLLERTDDDAIWDIAADQLYSGGLKNSGERLRLIDPAGRLVDGANLDGGNWPAGNAENHYSMERYSDGGAGGYWGSFTGYRGVGQTKGGGDIAGTPGAANSILFPTPTPTWIPGQLIINEVLVRPHYDWDGTGKTSTDDEFIEIYNRGPGSVRLQGFTLDDIPEAGSRPFRLPGIRLEPDRHVAFFRSESHIALNDGGDRVRLLDPSGRVVDEIVYLRIRAYNLSYGRLPDASNRMAYGLWPTPGEANLLFVAAPQDGPPGGQACEVGEVLEARLPRSARRPAQRRWFDSFGLANCRRRGG